MQNIYLGVHALKSDIDWKKFSLYLQKKYQVTKIFLFLGYIENNSKLYKKLKNWGYTLIFKEVTIGKDGNYKGNVDAELVLEAVDRINQYDKALLASGDGDFLCLINYWRKHGKQFTILSASKNNTSFLLKKYARNELQYLGRPLHLFTKKLPPKDFGGPRFSEP